MNPNSGNLGYPTRLKQTIRFKEALKDTQDIWVKTKRILDLKQRMQDDLRVVVNEDTLHHTLKETQGELEGLYDRQK